MGVFLLCTGPPRPDSERGALQAIAEGGFPPAWTLDEPGFRLSVHGPLSGAAPAVVRFPGGDFAAIVGTLIHQGRTGWDAARSLWHAFDPAGDPWDGTAGHWNAVLRKRGTAYLLSDRLGVCRIYRDGDGAAFSNSFLAMCAMGGAGGLDAQGTLEYVLNGVPFGCRTLFAGIGALPRDSAVEIEAGAPALKVHPSPFRVGGPKLGKDFQEIAETCLQRLRAQFRTYAALWPDRVRSALSGGWDSRLLLALLQDSGMRAELFVYGAKDSPDVRVAKAVALAEGLGLEHIDKGGAPVAPGDFPAIVAADCVAFDGWKAEGLFDGGADRADRMGRSLGGRVLMNGSAGEVLRNFYHLGGGRRSFRDLVWTFHSRWDPAAMGPDFDSEAYEKGVAGAIASALGAPADEKLPRAWTEMAYPLFRGRWWTARDAALNQRFGPALYPFLEPAVFDGTWTIPLGMKNCGRLEARLIERLSPRLAAVPTVYGFAPAGPVPAWARALDALERARPPLLRKLAYRLAGNRPRLRPWYLADAMLETVMDVSFPATRHLFRRERLHDPEAFNRLCTAEYLAQRFGAGA